jgi:predicted O-linked N-acetylglucosamine transferase (SPINDLY family)
MTDSALIRTQIRQRALKLVQQGETDEAGRLIEELIASDPADAQAWFCQGVRAQCDGRHAEAIESYRHALTLESRLPNASNNLGLLLEQQGRLEEAMECYTAAVACNANFIPALLNCGNVASKLVRWSDAVGWFDRALGLNDNNPQAHFGRALALRGQGRPKEAVAALERAIALKPDYTDARNVHAEILLKRNMISEAIRSLEIVLQSDRTSPGTWLHLGGAHLLRGDVREACDYYLEAVRLGAETDASFCSYSNYLLSLNYLTMDPAEVFRAHREWATHYGYKGEHIAHSNLPDPGRRLRVGYLSGDFSDHPVAIFIKSILQNHDRSAFEVIAFSSVARPDETTKLLRYLTDQWHDILRRGDNEVADLVRSEAIDILVDLSGHTGGNRLGVFVRKPAPVQVTYLGYPNTTGLREMDFRITDPVADPPGDTEAWHTEKLIRLPHTFLCFAPPPTPPAVLEAPLIRNGYVTFGSVSNLAKISSETLDDWAAVLKAVVKSRLILKRGGLRDESIRNEILHKFSCRGIAPERIDLLAAGQARDDHFSHYAQLDIVLDTFPYNGTTTTCESLLMGVPIVTRYGQTHVSRVGLSLLSSVGLEELAGATHDEFVERAVSLAKAPERLRSLRVTLRDRFLKSPVCDSRGFVRNLENAYRQVWSQWCGTHDSRTDERHTRGTSPD